jgi:menaquinone-dependent protoporphyrinogen IX oxidase
MEASKMSRNKTLIAYETKGGATEETARKIADILRSKYELEVDLVDLRVQNIKDFASYRNIIVGGGVRGGKVYGKALKCLENNMDTKQVAFFVCAGGAGDKKSYEKSKIEYSQNTIAKYPKISPVSVEAFGGRMKILGKKVLDNLDLSKVEAWAEDLGKKFIQ